MTTIMAPLWMVAGFCAVFVVVAGWLERVRWWLRDRVAPLLEDDDDRIYPDDPYDACPECGSWTQCEHDREQLGLPPERTWEQMTSHQLPLADPGQEQIRRPGRSLPAAGMSPAERKDWQHREGVRRRQARRCEMGYRAHYAAMGFEFPSGLLARVREAGQ